MDVLLAGDAERVAALVSALRERGVSTAHAGDDPSLVESLVSLESGIQAEPPNLAVGVGTGEVAIALAVTAPKLGVPFTAWASADERPDERRILETLSENELSVQEGDAGETAERIAAWLAKKTPRRDLDSGS
jgi:hypothetical protein